MLHDASIVATAKETFRREIGETTYRPLLPEGQQPPANLNAGAMDKWYPLMEPNYVRETSRFEP